jgi:hypothetical protein
MSTPHVTATVAGYCLYHYSEYAQDELANGSLVQALANATIGTVQGSMSGATNKLIYIGQNTVTNVVPPPPPGTSRASTTTYSAIILMFYVAIIVLFLD